VSDESRLSAVAPPAGSEGVSFDVAGIESAAPPDPLLAWAPTPGFPLVEKFKVLRTKLESIDEARRLRCFGVVAAAAREGTTTIALGLAVSLAREGARRVLLIEGVLRRPVLEGRLGLSPAPGLSDWLANGASGPVPVRQIEPSGTFFLSGGAPQAEPAQLLESPAMAHLLEGARRAFDFTVVDCPPLLPLADSVLVQDLLDGFVLVVRSRFSTRDLILQAVSQLKPDRVQGVVFNDDHEVLARHRGRSGKRRA
jgi:Mrp family chromosome partitioning ATPase